MLIHFITTTQEFFKVVETDSDSNGKTDSRPERVTTTDPIPELEHVLGIDTEFSDLFSVGGEGNKVLSYVAGL
jgi:hypothetical protein